MSKKYSKIALSVTTAVGAFALSNTAFAESAQALQLSKIVQQVNDLSPTIKAARSQARSDHQGTKIAKGAYWPTLTVSGGYGYSGINSSPNGDFPGQLQDGQADQANATLTQLFFDGMGREDRIDFNKDKTTASRYKAEEAQQTTTLNATEAYLNILRFSQLAQLAKANVKTHEEILTQLRTAAGTEKPENIPLAEGRLAQAELRQKAIKGQLKNAEIAYTNLLDAKPAVSVEQIAKSAVEVATPEQVPEALANAVSKPIDAFLGNKVVENGDTNPAQLADDSTLKSTKDAIGVAKSSFWPVVTGQVSANSGKAVNGLSGRNTYAQAMVLANWNIFNGFRDIAAVRQAEQNEATAQNNLNATQLKVDQSIDQAKNDMNITKDSLNNLETHADQSKTVAEKYKVLRKDGTVSQLNYLDVTNEHYNAQTDYINGLYQLVTNEYTLLAAMGKLPQTLTNNHIEMSANMNLNNLKV